MHQVVTTLGAATTLGANQVVALLHVRGLHLLDLLLKRLAQRGELAAHPLEQEVDVLRLLLERLDVLVVLALDLELELGDQLVLRVDDTIARLALLLNLVQQLLRDSG